MPNMIKRTTLKPVAYLPKKAKYFVAGFFLRGLKKEFAGFVTDKFIELLLHGMDLCFFLFEDYRKDNIEEFEGRYLIMVGDDGIAAAATFKNGNMYVHHKPIKEWDVKITFQDTTAFKEFIFSKNLDILNSILKNKVRVHGNLNYIYKLGFMARDLQHRFDIG